MKVLLPIDESQFSEQAIKEVEERFRTPDTTVRVLHVVAKFVPPAATLWDAGGSLEAAREEVLSRYRGLVEGVAERLTAAGVTAETAIREGAAGKVIINEAKEWGADLIVLGSHGHARLVQMLLGSVAQYVVDHAPCSVEVVHRKDSKANE
jgi:nucleotide-binding universal stress UspA family protein